MLFLLPHVYVHWTESFYFLAEAGDAKVNKLTFGVLSD